MTQEIHRPSEFPIKTYLCLDLLIDHWRTIANSAEGLRKRYAKKVLEELDKTPELKDLITDMSVLTKHKNMVDDLMAIVIPPSLDDQRIISAVIPYSSEGFYNTAHFDRLFPEGNAFAGMKTDVSEEEMILMKTVHAYSSILRQFFGHNLEMRKNMVFPIEKDGKVTYFKLVMDLSYIQFKFNGKKLKTVTEDDLHRIEENIYDLSVWHEYINPEEFTIQGFGLFHFIDVTGEEVLSTLKYQLLENDSIQNKEKFEHLEKLIRSLMGVDDMQLGVAAFKRKHNQVINYGSNIYRSFFLPKDTGITCECSLGEMYDELSVNPSPRFFADLQKDNPMAEMGEAMMAQGIRNIVGVPLLHNGQLVGMLEMTSPRPHAITTTRIKVIDEIAPLFAMAIQRGMEELENRIQRVIKEEYTAIHSSVEWRFVDAAVGIIEQETTGETRETEGISFDEVYPLYGTSDVRGSSNHRNKVIKGDLQEQLALASKVLEGLFDILDMPILQELNHRVQQYYNKLDSGLYSGDEFSIIEFLQKDIEPFFKDLVSDHNEYQNITNIYWREIDDNLGFLYKRRKAYERSLTMINESLAHILDKEEDRVQRMFPHYFEKYHTDGVEYNIYMGQSIAPHRKFNHTYLQNLRIWQLELAIEMARESHRIMPELPMPLELTHLILLQSNPLSIRFRQDEKQFDVDGAYNVRYEIVKKRIDKAVIKGTNERLTQPDKVAVVYSYDKDLQEYYQYIEYLRNKNMIKGEVEELELEDLQGVYGLKALRFEVMPEKVEKKAARATKKSGEKALA